MKKIDLTKGKVIKVLTALALPIMGSSLLQFTYNIVDMFWVGALGSEAVASIGSSSFFIGLGYSINSITVIGAGIKVAHSLGKNNDKEVKEYINTSLILNFILALVYSSILILFGKAFIGFLDINNSVVESNGYWYLVISAPTMVFTFFNVLFTRIFSSYGNNSDALKITTIGIIINIIFDPILIYILNWGVLGAATATLIAQLVMFILFILKSKGILRYNFKIGFNKKRAVEIIKLGLPMSFQRILFTLVNIILAKVIAIYGPNAIAAQKIALQIESVTYMVIGGLNGAISSFTGQNFGANKVSRIKEGYNKALEIGIIYSIIMAIIFMFFNEPIIELFIKDKVTINIASNYLKIVAFSQVFSTVEMVSNGLFTGVGMPKVPSIISIIFTILRIPMAIILIRYFDLNGVWISIAISSILKGITAYIIYLITVRKRYRNVE